jgi:hypothetical protein
MRNHVYKPYVVELLAIESVVDPVLQVSDANPHRRSAVIETKQRWIDKMRGPGTRALQLLDIVTGRALLVFRGTAY